MAFDELCCMKLKMLATSTFNSFNGQRRSQKYTANFGGLLGNKIG